MAFISDAARFTYDLAFQVSPVILVDGVASLTVGGMLPIIAFTGQFSSILGLSNPGLGTAVSLAQQISTGDYFARFVPVPGSTLVSQQIATYPFANQTVAANATIQQPLNISLRMIAPVKDTAGYLTKLSTFMSLQKTLVAHNAAGGTYHIATPAYIYKNCILQSMTDVTGGGTKQQQIEFQLDFLQPLVTQQAATSALNGLMSKLNSGAQLSSAAPLAGTSFWSNAATAVGSAAQGAVQGVNSLVGVVNQYLSSP